MTETNRLSYSIAQPLSTPASTPASASGQRFQQLIAQSPPADGDTENWGKTTKILNRTGYVKNGQLTAAGEIQVHIAQSRMHTEHKIDIPLELAAKQVLINDMTRQLAQQADPALQQQAQQLQTELFAEIDQLKGPPAEAPTETVPDASAGLKSQLQGLLSQLNISREDLEAYTLQTDNGPIRVGDLVAANNTEVDQLQVLVAMAQLQLEQQSEQATAAPPTEQLPPVVEPITTKKATKLLPGELYEFEVGKKSPAHVLRMVAGAFYRSTSLTSYFGSTYHLQFLDANDKVMHVAAPEVTTETSDQISVYWHGASSDSGTVYSIDGNVVPSRGGWINLMTPTLMVETETGMQHLRMDKIPFAKVRVSHESNSLFNLPTQADIDAARTALEKPENLTIEQLLKYTSPALRRADAQLDIAADRAVSHGTIYNIIHNAYKNDTSIGSINETARSLQQYILRNRFGFQLIHDVDDFFQPTVKEIHGIQTKKFFTILTKNEDSSASITTSLNTTRHALDLKAPHLNAADAKITGAGFLDFRGRDLSRVDLATEELTQIDLRAANLTKANLNQTTLGNLVGTNLQGASLVDANLRASKLIGTNLNNTNLSRANLENAIIKNRTGLLTNLSDANLTNADLNDAILPEADLRGANLKSASLEGANLRGANLTGANIEGADFDSAHLKDADLSNLDFTKTKNFNPSSISGANLSGSNLSGTSWNHFSFKNTNMTGVNFHQTNLQSASFLGANLIGNNFSEADLSNTNFIKANLKGVNLKGANIGDANFSQADLSGANLQNTNLRGMLLNDANLQYADLSGASLKSADVRGANFTGAILTGTKMSPDQIAQLNLTDRQLAQLKADPPASLAPSEQTSSGQSTITPSQNSPEPNSNNTKPTNQQSNTPDTSGNTLRQNSNLSSSTNPNGLVNPTDNTQANHQPPNNNSSTITAVAGDAPEPNNPFEVINGQVVVGDNVLLPELDLSRGMPQSGDRVFGMPVGLAGLPEYTPAPHSDATPATEQNIPVADTSSETTPPSARQEGGVTWGGDLGNDKGKTAAELGLDPSGKLPGPEKAKTPEPTPGYGEGVNPQDLNQTNTRDWGGGPVTPDQAKLTPDGFPQKDDTLEKTLNPEGPAGARFRFPPGNEEIPAAEYQAVIKALPALQQITVMQYSQLSSADQKSILSRAVEYQTLPADIKASTTLLQYADSGQTSVGQRRQMLGEQQRQTVQQAQLNTVEARTGLDSSTIGLINARIKGLQANTAQINQQTQSIQQSNAQRISALATQAQTDPMGVAFIQPEAPQSTPESRSEISAPVSQNSAPIPRFMVVRTENGPKLIENLANGQSQLHAYPLSADTPITRQESNGAWSGVPDVGQIGSRLFLDLLFTNGALKMLNNGNPVQAPGGATQQPPVNGTPQTPAGIPQPAF